MGTPNFVAITGLAEMGLGPPHAIAVRGIEEVDTGVERGAGDLLARLVLDRHAEVVAAEPGQ
jgi:hypothetical protein